MVVKSKKKSAGKGKKVKVLSLKKETVRNLTGGESKRVKGGTTACMSLIRASVPVVSGGGTSLNSTSGAISGSGASSIIYSGR